ncbi:acyltransferase family protein [Priestia flexa]|uniref:acyltransferase family protein n=1 Tax=Priestia flexa TaxID=86664 RepID=UPI001F4CD131|nr:acyltransferase [Priestia flexa]
MEEDRRVKWVDYAKAIGIFLVVYGHVLRGINSAGFSPPSELFALSDKVIYGFHMPLFFFLSGLFIVKSIDKGAGRNLKQKAVTLLIPYFVWSIIQGTVEVLLSSVSNSTYSFIELTTDVVFNPIGQFWFIYVLFIINAIVYLIYKHISLNVLLVFSIVLAITANYVNLWLIDEIMCYSVYFILGVYLSKINVLKLVQFKMSNKVSVLLTLLIFIMANYIYFSFIGRLNYGTFGSLILALSGILFIISTSAYLSTKNLEFLRYIGVNSMIIYLVHIIAGSGTRIIIDKFLNYQGYTVHLLFGVMAGVILPLLTLEVSKHIKLQGVLFGYKTNNQVTQKG